MITRKEYTLKSVHITNLYINPKIKTSMNKEELTPEQRDTWTKVLKFAVDVLKLIISAFLGGSASSLLN